MNPINLPKITALVVIAFLTLVLMPLVLKLTIKRYKNEFNPAEELKTAMAVWTGSLFLSLAIVWAKMLSVLLEAVNISLKVNTEKILPELLRIISLFFAVGVFWFALLFWVGKLVCLLIPVRRNAKEEMELDGVGYFLVRGVILVGLAVCFLTLEEVVLRVFVPGVGVPYFH